MAVFTGLGSAAAPSITFSADTNTGMFSPGADQVAVSTGGTGRLFVAASGNVGIGITSPGELLSVDGSVSITSTNRIKTSDSGGNLTIQGGATFPGGHIILNGGNGSDNIIFNRSSTSASTIETARIDSSGRLLIGTSSTAIACRQVLEGKLCRRAASVWHGSLW